MCLFRCGFPKKDRCIFRRFFINDIYFVRIKVKKDIYARRVLFMDIISQGAIPLTFIDENVTPHEIEQKAVELAYLSIL